SVPRFSSNKPRSGGDLSDPMARPSPNVGPFKALPPRLRTQARVLVTDQNDPAYDAYQLVTVLDTSVATVFDSETRDLKWAPVREAAIAAIVERDLTNVQAHSRLVRTECHHSTCEMLFEGPTLEEARWGSILLQYA